MFFHVFECSHFHKVYVDYYYCHASRPIFIFCVFKNKTELQRREGGLSPIMFGAQWLPLIVLCLALCLAKEEDLYKTLGVSKTATTKVSAHFRSFVLLPLLLMAMFVSFALG